MEFDQTGLPNVEERYGILKDKEPEVLLKELNEDYIKTGSLLLTYAALSVIAVDMDGEGENLHKSLDFTLGSGALGVLEGEYLGGGIGNVNQVTTEGLMLDKGYNPSPQHKPAYDQWKKWEGLIETTDGLFMRIGPHERWIKLSTYLLNDKRRLRIEHVAMFDNLQLMNQSRYIYGPRILVREDEQTSLYESGYQKNKWLKLLNILREPKIEKIATSVERWNGSLIF